MDCCAHEGPGGCISVLGGIQPGPLERYLREVFRARPRRGGYEPPFWYAVGRDEDPPGVRSVLLAVSVAVVASGCGGNSWSLREFFGLPRVDDPTLSLRATETKWLLIKNPRFGDVASEPEYIWVEEDKVPTTMKSLVFGKSTLLASPDIVAKYGAPPGGGRISTRQGGAYKVENTAPTVPTNSRGPVASVPGTTRTDAAGGVGAQPSTRTRACYAQRSWREHSSPPIVPTGLLARPLRPSPRENSEPATGWVASDHSGDRGVR
jgi:hypothetical protein